MIQKFNGLAAHLCGLGGVQNVRISHAPAPWREPDQPRAHAPNAN